MPLKSYRIATCFCPTRPSSGNRSSITTVSVDEQLPQNGLMRPKQFAIEGEFNGILK
jgi:hypothetical protein